MVAVSCFLKGWRTLAACLSFLVVGLLSVAGGLDLTPVVALFVKDPAYLGAAMVLVAMLFGYLRWISTTPMFKSHHSEDDTTADRPRCVDGGV